MAKRSPEKRAPEKVFRIGFVSASVFVNEAESQGGTREFRSVNVQRSYRDGEETRFTSSFTLSELPLAIRVLRLAQKHVEEAEANGAAG